MSAVTLSAGVRSTLLSLQGTAALTSAVQTRLATGKRVNSALENPRSFFTSLSLTSRAGDLNALLDTIAQAQQTVKTVALGISSLTKLVQTAKSLTQQARQAPLPQTGYDAIEVTGSADASGEAAGLVTGNVDTSVGGFLADVEGLQIQVGASTYTVHQPSSPTPEGISTIISRINGTSGLGPNGAVTASLDATGKFLRLTSNSTDVSFQVLASAAATSLGVAGGTGTSTNLLQAVPSLAGTILQVQATGGGTKTVNFGNGAGQVSTLEEFQSALASSGVFVSLTGSNVTLTVPASSGTRNSLTTSGSALTALGMSPINVQYGVVNSTTPDPTRTSLQSQYNTLLQQIDALTSDSSYHGVNLLKGDNLATTFNENSSSSLTISGVSLDATGLGLSVLTGADFQSNFAIDDITGKLDTALTSLRTQALRFGSGLTTLQTRYDFTRTLVKTLEAGADDLVLADTDQEGANLLALQTRQALSMTALSLSSQGTQAVLRLFQ
jgi:flagellin-like hook-associated protein FlgL